MKNLIKTIICASVLVFTFGCSDSKFDSDQDLTTLPAPTDPLTPFSPGSPSDPNFQSHHCGDILEQQTQFYSYMKSVSNKGSYGELLESQGICKTRNGWTKYTNNSSYFWQYEQNLGTSSCDYWNKTPMGITLAFFRGYPNTVSIAVDATGDGWAMNGGQGFPVRQAQLAGGIDCSQTDLTIYSQTANGYLQIVVPKEYGNKQSADMRATIYFNGNKLGTTFLRRQ